MIITLYELYKNYKNYLQIKGEHNKKEKIEEGDFLILQEDKIVEVDFIVGLPMKDKILVNVIISYKVVTCDDESISLVQVPDMDVWGSARSPERRPVFITGYKALEKKIMGCV